MLVFFKDINDEEKTSRISLLKLEHIHYKKDSLYEKSKALLKNKPEQLKKLYFLDGSSE